jgi:hypothetical protein
MATAVDLQHPGCRCSHRISRLIIPCRPSSPHVAAATGLNGRRDLQRILRESSYWRGGGQLLRELCYLCCLGSLAATSLCGTCVPIGSENLFPPSIPGIPVLANNSWNSPNPLAVSPRLQGTGQGFGELVLRVDESFALAGTEGRRSSWFQGKKRCRRKRICRVEQFWWLTYRHAPVQQSPCPPG